MYAVRELHESELDPGEHGLMVPLPGDERDAVVLEDRDGANVTTLRCKAMKMHTDGEKKPFMRISDISAQLYVTDCRLAFACSKFDKGGGWVGGPTAMIVFNAGSKLLAARRRHGKMLVGHIRYPWIQSVYAQNHVTMRHAEMLRIVVKLPGDASWTKVEFELPKDLDATALGAEIIRRSARFRLSHEPELGDEERAHFAELANLDGLVWDRESGKLAGHTFKTHWPVSEKSGRIGSAAAPRAVEAGAPVEPAPEAVAWQPEPEPQPKAEPQSEVQPTPQPESRPAEVESPEFRFCGSCGAEHGENDAFCGSCGEKLTGMEASQ